MNKFDNILGKAEIGERLERSDALHLANFDDVAQLMMAASLLGIAPVLIVFIILQKEDTVLLNMKKETN